MLTGGLRSYCIMRFSKGYVPRLPLHKLPLLLACLISAAFTALAGGRSFHTKANVMVELAFATQQTYADPFNQIVLDVVFFDPSGRELRVPAFWDGGKVWKARYASPLIGTHSFHTECSEAHDAGLNGVTGKVEITAYQGTNPLYAHGPVRVAASHLFFEHLDGTPFFWLGDTWWMGLCHRLRWPDEIHQLANDRKEKGFNVIQIVAGLYPDMFPFDPRGANETGFPWQTNYSSIRPEYFDAADQRLCYLVDQGLTPCIVGAWGYFMPWMGVEKMKAHWRNLIARYGALPVIWCAAGEANLPWYLAKGFPYDDRNQVHDWTEVLRYIRATDPWHRPLTLHPTGIGPLTARHSTDDPALIDFDMLQTPHGRQEAVPVTINTVRQSCATAPAMPVIDGEASYEMLFDSLPTEWTRRMFWVCLMNGAAGHTYGANGIWQCNRPGLPHGPSPNGGNGYGAIPWNDAMRLPGSQQVGFGKRLLEQFPWQDFHPHPEWVHWSECPLAHSAWIWFPEGNPALDAPAARRFFRRTFVLAPGKTVSRARLHISADDRFSAQLNGNNLGSGADWNLPRQFNDLAPLLTAGTNVLAIAAENMPAPGANPAGLIAMLDIQFAVGGAVQIVSDESWRCAKTESAGWNSTSFDDSAWTNAMMAARYSGGPWGKIDGPNDDTFAPQSAGIAGVVRVIYAPRADPLEIRQLGPNFPYNAKYFDPVSGVTTRLGEIRSDTDGLWNCPPPSGLNHDWVLILELKKQSAQVLPRQLTLSNQQLAWHFDWSDGSLHSTWFDNKLTRHRFVLSDVRELKLNFSAVPDRVEEPFAGAADFEVRAARLENAESAVFELRPRSVPISVTLHVQLDGATRRKWIEVTNLSDHALLLLDADLDDFTTPGATSGGGNGKPLFIEDEAFAAIEHPAGVNSGKSGRVELSHFPGKKLAPGAVFRSHVALVSVAEKGAARAQFVSYLEAKSLRPKKFLSVYTPFGINNQWGACPTLDDEQTLDVLGLLQKFQTNGVRFDYFTLDTGWVDPASDLTRFRPTCFPNGPAAIVDRVQSLGMKFGLWFGTSWATQSCWDYAPAYATGRPPGLPWREGSPLTEGGINFCFASEPYFSIFKNAVLYHLRENKVRLLKFDGGNYYCDSDAHGHLPGKYSVEAMFNNLIDVARSARAVAPDVFIIWYWGAGSPFWALYGDMVFESGLEMEGSGTSAFPTLFYRDSVTLAQDQNAQFASTIPPVVKDSLGVWLADSRWGNFMGKERWREALVMDLGRGSLLFPNLWGDLYLLNDDDISFLRRISAFARQNESLFRHRKNILGDPALNQPYGYAYGNGQHALLFLNNAHFASRRVELALDSSLGLDAPAGSVLHIVSLFPDETRLRRPDGAPFKTGDTLDLSLRPFEVLMLEISPNAKDKSFPIRSISAHDAAQLGCPLPLRNASPDKSLDARFADATTFAAKNLKPGTQSFEAVLPELGDDPPIMAVAIRLRRGDAEWKYAPTVEQIVQPILRIDDENVQMVPVPDGRQYGNTQSFGSSWVVYKVRLPKRWSGKPLQLAVHSWLPDGVQAKTEAWVIKQWWQNETRPSADGYYTDAPQ
jgi:hypothetical protein